MLTDFFFHRKSHLYGTTMLIETQIHQCIQNERDTGSVIRSEYSQIPGPYIPLKMRHVRTDDQGQGRITRGSAVRGRLKGYTFADICQHRAPDPCNPAGAPRRLCCRFLRGDDRVRSQDGCTSY